MGGGTGRLFRAQSPPASLPLFSPALATLPRPRFTALARGPLERGRTSAGPARGPAGCARGATRANLGVGQLMVFFPLHTPVLEPDLDLALGQAERVRDLDAPPPRQVAVVVELLLQLQRLVARVGLAASLAVGPCAQR